jgi:hypothetical protein
MLKRIEIEKLENGFKVDVYKQPEEKDDDKDSDSLSHMYPEPKKYVAKNEDEVISLIKECLGKTK